MTESSFGAGAPRSGGGSAVAAQIGKAHHHQHSKIYPEEEQQSTAEQRQWVLNAQDKQRDLVALKDATENHHHRKDAKDPIPEATSLALSGLGLGLGTTVTVLTYHAAIAKDNQERASSEAGDRPHTARA